MHACEICGTDVKNVKSYLGHSRIHTNLPKSRLTCCFENCCNTTASLSGLRWHLIRNRSSAGARRPRTSMCFVGLNLLCTVPSCSGTFSNSSQLVKHFQQHTWEDIDCPISNCRKQYTVHTSFASHLSRDHPQWT
jgi:hypothetical protein